MRYLRVSTVPMMTTIATIGRAIARPMTEYAATSSVDTGDGAAVHEWDVRDVGRSEIKRGCDDGAMRACRNAHEAHPPSGIELEAPLLA